MTDDETTRPARALTPVPSPRCTGCPHLPHAHACPECGCGVATLPAADHHTTSQKLDMICGIVERMASRVEYLIEEVVKHHEAVRRVPLLVADVAALRARIEDHDDWERSRADNGGGL